jgi:hypothetical protein
VAIDRDFTRARQLGIDVNQVGESLARHLSEERQRVRDNPRLLEPLPDEPINLAVTERRKPDRVVWETLGTLPFEVSPVTVFASSREAALNRCSLRELLERRYRREFALGLVRASLYPDTVEGRRSANRRAISASLHVADTAA